MHLRRELKGPGHEHQSSVLRMYVCDFGRCGNVVGAPHVVVGGLLREPRGRRLGRAIEGRERSSSCPRRRGTCRLLRLLRSVAPSSSRRVEVPPARSVARSATGAIGCSGVRAARTSSTAPKSTRSWTGSDTRNSAPSLPIPPTGRTARARSRSLLRLSAGARTLPRVSLALTWHCLLQLLSMCRLLCF